MLKRTENILKELKDNNLILKKEDLTGDSKTNLIFDYMINKYSCLLENGDPILPKNGFLRDIFYNLIKNYGKYFLSNPQIIEDIDIYIKENEEILNYIDPHFQKSNINEIGPVIYLTNHYFKDDILATMTNVKKNTLILFGSLPQFYGTTDGLLSAMNGVIIINRKMKESKSVSVLKGKYALEHDMNLMICPEGVWNKKPNELMLDFWSGFYRIAKKNDGTFYPIIPIVHYISNTYETGKSNPIHTIIDNPIYLDGMNEQDGVKYIRERMLTWYWLMMEKYGISTRNELLTGFNNSKEAWEYELNKRLEKVKKYDSEIEFSADRRRRDDPILVWEKISELDINRLNINEVLNAKKKVKQLKENDFQHRM